jgi:hypothetical protein
MHGLRITARQISLKPTTEATDKTLCMVLTNRIAEFSRLSLGTAQTTVLRGSTVLLHSSTTVGFDLIWFCGTGVGTQGHLSHNPSPRIRFLLLLIIIFAALGFELRVSCLLGRCCYCLSHSPSPRVGFRLLFYSGFDWIIADCIQTKKLIYCMKCLASLRVFFLLQYMFFSKINFFMEAEGVEVVEFLPSQGEALSSSPGTAKKMCIYIYTHTYIYIYIYIHTQYIYTF